MSSAHHPLRPKMEDISGTETPATGQFRHNQKSKDQWANRLQWLTYCQRCRRWVCVAEWKRTHVHFIMTWDRCSDVVVHYGGNTSAPERCPQVTATFPPCLRVTSRQRVSLSTEQMEAVNEDLLDRSIAGFPAQLDQSLLRGADE